MFTYIFQHNLDQINNILKMDKCNNAFASAEMRLLTSVRTTTYTFFLWANVLGDTEKTLPMNDPLKLENKQNTEIKALARTTCKTELNEFQICRLLLFIRDAKLSNQHDLLEVVR